MNEQMLQPYFLLHITSQKCYDGISKSKAILPSHHDIHNKKIQWVGDGIYFWDANDEEAIKIGKNLVKGKYNTNKLVGIYVSVTIDKNKHMNLEKDNWYTAFAKYMQKAAPLKYQKILDYFEIIKKQEKVYSKLANKLGALTGTAIMSFINYLNLEGLEIDMVSGYFYHEKNTTQLFKRETKTIRQFCIKKTDLVNNNISNWIVNKI